MSHPLSALQQEMLDAITSAIVIKNSHGVILAHNRAFRDLNPNAPDKLIGLTAHDFLPAIEANLIAKADQELLNNPSGYLQHELVVFLDANHKFWLGNGEAK